MTAGRVSFSPGDVVRVKPDCLEGYWSDFAKRVKDRDAIVDCQGSDCYRQNNYWVVFQKRSGRGKEFRESLRADDLYLVRAAQQEAA
jgi:hypothetical protein